MAMLSLLVISCASCKPFRFDDIRSYSHSENEDECFWLNSKTGDKIPCVDEKLKSYMCIPIEEYVDFTRDYVCKLKEEIEEIRK